MVSTMQSLPSDLNSWLGLAALIIAAAVGIKKLRERSNPEAEFVTRGELGKLKEAVDLCLTKKDFGEFKSLLEKQQEKLETKLDENAKRTERLLVILEYTHLIKKMPEQDLGANNG
jgi:hypothetical protein